MERGLRKGHQEHTTMARRDQSQYTRDEGSDGKGQGAKPDAPRGRKTTSGKRSTGARKSANRPGPSGTGSKKGTRGSSGARRSGSRSGGGQGNKKR
jgi:hypothetical protein